MRAKKQTVDARGSAGRVVDVVVVDDDNEIGGTAASRACPMREYVPF